MLDRKTIACLQIRNALLMGLFDFQWGYGGVILGLNRAEWMGMIRSVAVEGGYADGM
jgi:hypothetical protein